MRQGRGRFRLPLVPLTWGSARSGEGNTGVGRGQTRRSVPAPADRLCGRPNEGRALRVGSWDCMGYLGVVSMKHWAQHPACDARASTQGLLAFGAHSSPVARTVP